MIISPRPYIPRNSSKSPSVEIMGEVLTINGEALDFSQVPEGATLPRSAIGCVYIAEDVVRTNGVLHIGLSFPIPPDASEAARFPEPIINPPDGPLELPV